LILSVSRRTDIPCFYADWLYNRLKAGAVYTRNPMNHEQVSKVLLSPEVVDCIVFWSKDPAPLMPYLERIGKMGYAFYFQFTLTPYGRTLEPYLRDKNEIEETFLSLSRRIGKERMLWRYDPVVLNEAFTVKYHKEQFVRLCEKLHPYTESVTISFVDLYSKLKTELIRPVSEGEIRELGAYMGQTARNYGLVPKACCEQADLSVFGFEKASCIDKRLIEQLCGCPLDVPVDKNQRPGCGCCESVDIGAYNTCLNGCVYCYASAGEESARKRAARHDPEGELLVGSLLPDEKVVLRKAKSLKRKQVSFFDGN